MMPEASLVLQKVAIAAGLGLLVGLQRERVQVQIAAFRTFTIIPVLGCLCGFLVAPLGPWLALVGLAALVAYFILGNLMMPKDLAAPGITTEISAVLMFVCGLWLALGSPTVPVVVTGALVLLLSLKKPMHDLAGRIGEADFKAILQFVLIALVILPVLPNKALGPYQVLNPREIWLMVVLIVTISLFGYVLAKAFGSRAGTLLGGILGGIISSTATTVSYARRAKSAPNDAGANATVLVIMVASTIAFARFMVLVAAFAPHQASHLLPPLIAMAGVMAILTGALLPGLRKAPPPLAVTGSPSELKTALVFGGLYAVVIFLVAAANTHLGTGALYLISVISGTTDMDAITLSTARLMDKGQLSPELGWRLILIASLSNIAFKGLIAAVLGSRALAWRVAIAFTLAIAGGAGIFFFWR
ncbi:MAG: MgtC/SapB family protein [Spirochaetes bacterium]|nr:MgtC/SapB family protein [Spirochaetota bacterium]